MNFRSCCLPRTEIFMILMERNASCSAVRTAWIKRYACFAATVLWADEKPSDEIKAYTERQLQQHKIDVVLSQPALSGMNLSSSCPVLTEPMLIQLQKNGLIKSNSVLIMMYGTAVTGTTINTLTKFIFNEKFCCDIVE